VKRMVYLWRVCGATVVFGVVFVQVGLAQTTTATPAKPRPKAGADAKANMAVWTPEVQKSLGV
jgi:hypothetical protein